MCFYFQLFLLCSGGNWLNFLFLKKILGLAVCSHCGPHWHHRVKKRRKEDRCLFWRNFGTDGTTIIKWFTCRGQTNWGTFNFLAIPHHWGSAWVTCLNFNVKWRRRKKEKKKNWRAEQQNKNSIFFLISNWKTCIQPPEKPFRFVWYVNSDSVGILWTVFQVK